jgi:hypothetical protein
MPILLGADLGAVDRASDDEVAALVALRLDAAAGEESSRAETDAGKLVVVHGIDNDIACDTVSHKPFQAAFARVLETVAAGLPDSRIFVVSQFGSPTTHAKAVTIKQRLATSKPLSTAMTRPSPPPARP